MRLPFESAGPERQAMKSAQVPEKQLGLLLERGCVQL